MSTVFITTSVRDALAALLSADSDLTATGAKVVARRPKQLVSEIQKAIAQLTLGVVVLPCEIVRVNANTMPPLVEELRVALTVSESPLNSGPEAEEIAELLLVKLHGSSLPAVGPECVLYADERPWRTAETQAGLNLVTVSFRCVGLPAQPVQTP